MNQRNTIILVAIFVILGAYAWYTQFRTPDQGSAGPTPSSTPVVMFNFLTDNVKQLEVTDLHKKQTVQVARQGETWHMTQPKESDTDPLRVNETLGSLANLSATRVLTNVTDLAPFGLITPTLQARVIMSDTTQYTLQVGDQNPDKTSYYALKDSDKQVYLVDTTTIDGLNTLIENPPYPPTATPTPLPTPIPSATPAVTETVGAGTPGPSPAPSPTP